MTGPTPRRPRRPARRTGRARWTLLALLLAACAPRPAPAPERGGPQPGGAALADVGLNLDWLDWLSEDVVQDGDTLRFVWIYAEPVGGGAGRPTPPGPDAAYVHVGDDDEGIACVDDAARAAVLHLRHHEATGDERSRRAAVKLLRFVRAMQAESGLFYNFVWDRGLRINTTHPNSRADEVSWWTARAVWALGEGARVLADSDPDEAAAALAAARRVEPHLDRLLARYPETVDVGGRTFPRWLLYETAADATSELLLGLTALQQAAPTEAGARRVRLFAEGLAGLRFGSLGAFPYGGHASWPGRLARVGEQPGAGARGRRPARGSGRARVRRGRGAHALRAARGGRLAARARLRDRTGADVRADRLRRPPRRRRARPALRGDGRRALRRHGGARGVVGCAAPTRLARRWRTRRPGGATTASSGRAA